jgi:hypothetical protein
LLGNSVQIAIDHAKREAFGLRGPAAGTFSVICIEHHGIAFIIGDDGGQVHGTGGFADTAFEGKH